MATTFQDHAELRIYLELRQLGEQPVSVIARRLGMKRTTMYYMLERLEEQGVIEGRVERRIRMYRARPWSGVLGVFRERRKQLLKEEQALKRLWGRVS